MLKFPVLSFFGAAALFFTATLTAGIYGFSASKLNLWLALGLTMALNPLGLNGKGRRPGDCAPVLPRQARLLFRRKYGASGYLRLFWQRADC